MKKIRLLNVQEVFAEEPKDTKKTKKKTEEKEKKEQKTYVKTIPDKELDIAEDVKLVFSVSQTSPESPCHVDIRTWIESDKYSGPTKKGINFDIEYLDELISILRSVSEECAEFNK